MRTSFLVLASVDLFYGMYELPTVPDVMKGLDSRLFMERLGDESIRM